MDPNMKVSKHLPISLILVGIFSLALLPAYFLLSFSPSQKNNQNDNQTNSPQELANASNNYDRKLASAKFANILINSKAGSKEYNSTSSPAENYIVECTIEDELEQQQNDWSTINRDIFSQQVNLEIPEERLAAILFYQSKEKKDTTDYQAEWRKRNKNIAKVLFEYHQEFPTERLSYHRLLTFCTNQNHSHCTEDFYHKITQVDKENSLLWLTLASIKIKDKAYAEVLNALKQASLASSSYSYFFETIQLHYDVSKKYSPEHANKLFYEGIGFASAIALGYGEITNYCKNIERSNNLANELCLSVGEQMELKGKTVLEQRIGIAMQKIYHEKMANTEMVELMEIKAKAPYPFLGSEEFTKASTLFFYDPSLMVQWLNNGIKFGEAKAAHMLIDEAIWRSNDPNYNPCPHN